MTQRNHMQAQHSYGQCVFLLAIALTSACGGKESKPPAEAADSATAKENPPGASDGQTASESPASAPLTPEDIGRWEKGIAGELSAVHEAGAKLKQARGSEDTLNAMMGVQEMSTAAAGAQAAGMDEERYKLVRSNLSAVVGYLTPSLGGIDTTMLTQAQRDEMRRGNEAQLERMQAEVPADVIAAIRPRAAELRKKDMELVAARLKGAGMH
jgi:hypothetical protein